MDNIKLALFGIAIALIVVGALLSRRDNKRAHRAAQERIKAHEHYYTDMADEAVRYAERLFSEKK